MSKYKFEKIRDDDGEIRAYKLGNNTLVKHYYCGNNYEWLISRTGETYAPWSNAIRRKCFENGTLETCGSCKQGKERLIELFEQEKED